MIKPLKAFKKLGYKILPVLILLDKECPKTKTSTNTARKKCRGNLTTFRRLLKN